MPIARLLVRISLATVLSVISAAADTETRLPIEVTSAEMLNRAAGRIASAENYRPGEVSARTLPDAPAARTVVIDKKFIAAMAALGVAESLRITTHKLVLDHEYAAGAPWVTSVPANSHVVVKFSGIYAAELLAAYELKKPHGWLPGDRVIRKLWWVYPATMTPMHVANGIRSVHTQPPSACPVAECQ